jgi:hypothetical protein
MPPPPVPQRVMMQDPRGDPSRRSDISMHANCTSYPMCITEDADGRLLHNGVPANVLPSPVVNSRKEGSVAAASSPPKGKSPVLMSDIIDYDSELLLSAGLHVDGDGRPSALAAAVEHHAFEHPTDVSSGREYDSGSTGVVG